MSNRKQRFITSVCVLALAANSLTGLAQDKTPPDPTRVRTQTTETQLGTTLGISAPALNSTIAVEGHPIAYMPAVAATLPMGQVGYGTAGFMAAEAGFDSKLVKGAPFSAEQVTEFNQPLADGNRITRQSKIMIYRDGQGRTRREANAMPPQLAEFVEIQNLPKAVIITDPVEGATYVLDARERVARRSRASYSRTMMPAVAATGGTVVGGQLAATAPATAATTAPAATLANSPDGSKPALPSLIKVSGGTLQGSALKRVQPEYPAVAKAARAMGAVQVQITVSEQGEVIEASVVSGHPLLREASLEAARQWQFKPVELSGNPVKVQGVLTFNFTLEGENNKTVSDGNLAGKTSMPTYSRVQINQERLGKQLIEGVECEGTRITQTVPEGQIGNLRPIEIVTERWYSPELQVTVLTKQSDPRYGETVVRLANLLRVEPDELLFKVPSDFTIKDDIGFRAIEEKVRRPEQQ